VCVFQILRAPGSRALVSIRFRLISCFKVHLRRKTRNLCISIDLKAIDHLSHRYRRRRSTVFPQHHRRAENTTISWQTGESSIDELENKNCII